MKMLTTTTACISVSMTFSSILPHGTRPKNRIFQKCLCVKQSQPESILKDEPLGLILLSLVFFCVLFFLSLFPFLSPFYLWEKKKGGLLSALRKSC